MAANTEENAPAPVTSVPASAVKVTQKAGPPPLPPKVTFKASAPVYKNTAQPDWGYGVVVEEDAERWTFVFEHGGRRVFKKSVAKMLEPVTTLSADEVASLQAKAKNKHLPKAGGATPSKSKANKRTVARFANFASQLAVFEKLFPGGFDGEDFLGLERVPEGKPGYKATAIKGVREALSAERFASAPADELFMAARKVLASTTVVYAIEGAVPFGAIPEGDRAGVVAALKELLHGTDDYAARVEKFAATVTLKTKDGQARKLTWPLATVFGALWSPAENVPVKPAPFAEQGATLEQPIDAAPPITADNYRRFLAIAKETERRLKDANQTPKDLVDVSTFIARTHKAGPQ